MKIGRIQGCAIAIALASNYLPETRVSAMQIVADSSAEEQTSDLKKEPVVETQAAQAIAWEIFRRTISLSGKDVPLKDVLDQISAAAKVKIDVDVVAMHKARVELDRLYDISIIDTDLATVIMALFIRQKPNPVSVNLRVRDGTLFITTAAAYREHVREALPDWLKSKYDTHKVGVAVDDDRQIISLHAGDQLTDDMLANLPSLTKLRQLEIHGDPDVTLAGVSHLSKLTSLQQLTLSIGSVSSRETKLADAVLQSVAGLKSLTKLDLVESGVTDDGIRHFNALAQLTDLRIHREGRLTDAALMSIMRHKQLKSLDLPSNAGTSLGRMHFSREATSRLSRLKQLENLNLPGHEIAPEMFQTPRLKSLTISGNSFDGELAAAIANCPELASLDLHFNRVSDDALQHLAELNSLARLTLRCRTISDAAIAHLQHAPKLSHISLTTTRLSDESLGHLSNIKTLKELSLNWRENLFSLDGLKRLNRLQDLKSLELHIIPMDNRIYAMPADKPDKSQNVNIVLSPERNRPVVFERDRKRIPFDFDSLVDALPRTQILLTNDTFDHDGK